MPEFLSDLALGSFDVFLFVVRIIIRIERMNKFDVCCLLFA